MKYKIYTDGSALGQNKKIGWDRPPVRGGWAFVVLDESDNIVLKGSGNEIDTTNNRMELLAILTALRRVYKMDIDGEYIIYSDSNYSVESIETYAKTWQENGWRKRRGEIANLDLIKPLFEAKKYVKYKLKWVKGHDGNEYNEMVDNMAVKKAKDFASDMGVWKCVECGDKLFSGDGVHINGELYCKICSEEILIEEINHGSNCKEN